MNKYPSSAKELRSLVTKDGSLTLSIQDFPVPTPKDPLWLYGIVALSLVNILLK